MAEKKNGETGELHVEGKDPLAMAAVVARKNVEMLEGPAIDPPPGVTMRKASKDDLEGIKLLTKNTMEGTDFIPFFFLEYLEDPDRYFYVSILNDCVVACVFHYIVDGGKTLYGGGGRRHPAYKGQTIFKSLFRYALVSTLTANPSVLRGRDGSPHVEFNTKRLAGNPHTRFLPNSSMVIITMAKMIPSEDVAAGTSSAFAARFADLGVTKMKVRFASRDDMERILTDKTLREKVFPGDYFYAGLDIFEPRVVNLPAIFGKGNRELTISEDGLSVAVSQFWEATVGCFFGLRLHGKASAEMAMAHFLKLAEKFPKHCSAGQRVSCCYYLYESVDQEKFLCLCEKLPFFSKENCFSFDKYRLAESLIPSRIPSHM